MKILIIDDSPDFRALLRVQIGRSVEGAEVEEYDPARGRPGADFDWSRYNILLLDYKLGPDEDGLEWLRDYRRTPGFPPTIVLTGEGDEYIAVKAIKLGAAEYINKKDLTPNRLREVIVAAAGYSEAKLVQQQASMSQAGALVQRIQQEREQAPRADLGKDYRFVRLIGQGAMSQVFLAERGTDGLSVVLKTLDLTTVRESTLVDRFVQEAEMIAGLNSPFVVRIYEHGLTQKFGFIAMEFFPRGDLKQRMERRLTPDVVFSYMSYIAYGLEAIHGIGIVHRDLKPANIMFRGDDTMALADFGISKKILGGTDLTTIGQVLGTPHYMSPEQGEGQAVDYRSDLYSTGIILYELLTGQKPFTANTPAAVIYQHVHTEIPRLPLPLSRYQPIIDRAMAKEPDRRYQTAREMIVDFEAAEQGRY